MNIDQLTCYSNYALYRLPEHDSCTLLAQTQGEPLVVEAVSQLAGRKGFVMAPFEPTASHPILLMQPDVVETMAVEGEAADEAGVDPATDDADGREAYHRGFERFHAELATGRVGKLVLSRCVRQQMPGDMDVRRLFMQACRRYPHQYIALVSMQRSGTWLMATPEVLLDGDGRHWHTMALAGTMRMGGGGTAMEGVEWSEKNKAEQQYVSRYIEEILSRLATDVKMHGPYTTMAAHLLHLRTERAVDRLVPLQRTLAVERRADHHRLVMRLQPTAVHMALVLDIEVRGLQRGEGLAKLVGASGHDRVLHGCL